MAGRAAGFIWTGCLRDGEAAGLGVGVLARSVAVAAACGGRLAGWAAGGFHSVHHLGHLGGETGDGAFGPGSGRGLGCTHELGRVCWFSAGPEF